MSGKLWRRKDEWVRYSNCGDAIDFILPPTRDDGGPVANPAQVRAQCRACRVQPECAQWASETKANGVWAVGQYIPGHDEDKKAAKLVRQNLFESIPLLLERRGDDV